MMALPDHLPLSPISSARPRRHDPSAPAAATVGASPTEEGGHHVSRRSLPRRLLRP